jgi:hypothetical protein
MLIPEPIQNKVNAAIRSLAGAAGCDDLVIETDAAGRIIARDPIGAPIFVFDANGNLIEHIRK